MERFTEVPVVHNSLVSNVFFFVLSSDVHSELNMQIWEKTYTETQPIIRPSVVHTTTRTRHDRYDFRPCTRREFDCSARAQHVRNVNTATGHRTNSELPKAVTGTPPKTIRGDDENEKISFLLLSILSTW